MLTNLETLNRLRVNAGKAELKSWKASGPKLAEAIKTLTDAGFTDALPGANLDAKPKTDDPVVAAALPPEPKPDEVKPEPKVTNGEAKLGKGLETEPMARQSRIAVQMAKERAAREAKAEKKEDKAKSKAEKKAEKAKVKADKKAEPKIAGKVDGKKDPDKAARQKKHVEDKRAARAAKPKVEKNSNEITVADIARELDIDPKVARAKLRRHEEKIKKLHTKGQDRWSFPKTAKAELIKILK